MVAITCAAVSSVADHASELPQVLRHPRAGLCCQVRGHRQVVLQRPRAGLSVLHRGPHGAPLISTFPGPAFWCVSFTAACGPRPCSAPWGTVALFIPPPASLPPDLGLSVLPAVVRTALVGRR